jgi:hypothetical protein
VSAPGAVQRPAGFTRMAAVLALLAALGGAMLVLGRPPWTGDSPVLLALQMLLVALMAVTAEALWRVRPWCTRALTWTAVAAVAVFVAAEVTVFRVDLFAGFVVMLLFAARLARLVGYVEHEAAALFRSPRPRPARGAERGRAGVAARGRP